MKKIIYLICAMLLGISSSLHAMDYINWLTASVAGILANRSEEPVPADRVDDRTEEELATVAEQFIKAVTRGDLGEVQGFIDSGIDVNVLVNCNYDHVMKTALMEAAYLGHTEIVKLLLQARADVNIRHTNGYTAFQYAVNHGRIEIVNLLLQARADMKIPESRWKGLMVAAYCGYTEIIILLLQAGADVNIKERNKTPLIHAIEQGHIEIVNILLQSGVDDVNIGDHEGWTALMYAARSGYTEVVAQLLLAGADVNISNNVGRTALMYAAEHGRIEIVNLLLQAGADPTFYDCFNMTACEFAIRARHNKIVELLQNHDAILGNLDREAGTLIASARAGILNKNGQNIPVDDDVIAGIIKHYRPALVRLVHYGIIKENDHKELILDRALLDNNILMIQALIASGCRIPKNILKKRMCPSVRKYLEEHLARVETLYLLRSVHEEEPQNTLGLLTEELMRYLVSELAIADSSLILMLMAKTRTVTLLW